MAGDLSKISGKKSSLENDSKELVDAWFDEVGKWTQWKTAYADNYRQRYCEWLSTTDETEAENGDKRLLPFDGASDQKPLEIDDVCNSLTALMLRALNAADISAFPANHSNLAAARQTADFMKFYVRKKMADCAGQWECACQWMAEAGCSVMGVFWSPSAQLIRQKIRIEDFGEDFAQAAHAGDYDYIESTIRGEFPLALDSSIEKAVSAICGGADSAEISIPDKSFGRVEIKALKPGIDIYFPYDAEDLQKAPYVFVAETFDYEELRAKCRAEDWDLKAAEEAIENANGSRTANQDDYENLSKKGVAITRNDYERVEVVSAYFKTIDEDGYEHLKFAAFVPGARLGECVVLAKPEELDVFPQSYPFEIFKSEFVSRKLALARGAAEVGEDWQNTIKASQDTRLDRFAFGLKPPMLKRPGVDFEVLKPGVLATLRNLDDVKYLNLPPADPMSATLEGDVRKRMRDYFGLDADGGEIALCKRQRMVDNFLNFASRVLRQIFLCHCQNGNDVEYFKIAGYDSVSEYVRSDSFEDYDFSLSYSLPDPQADKTWQDIEAVAKFASSYGADRFDWSQFLIAAISARMPHMVDKLIVSPASAENRDYELMQQLLVKINSGMDVDLDENINPDIAANVLDQYLRGSDEIPAIDVQAKLAADQAFAKRIEKLRLQIRMKFEQRRNRQIGILGTPPGNMTVSGAAGMNGSLPDNILTPGGIGNGF